MPRRIAVVALAAAAIITVVVVVLTTGGGDDDLVVQVPAAAEAIETVEYLAFAAQPTACGAASPSPARSMQFAEPDDLGLREPVVAILHPSCGAITLELNPSSAPVTVNSFVFLAEQGYFDGTVSHRIVPGFVIQAGDPTATGGGGPGYLLPDELPASGFVYARGTVAMANRGPNTGGSQFFLVLEDSSLGPDFSVFGAVVDGFDVMERIATIPLTAREVGREPSSPLETLYLERVEIVR